MHEVELSYQVQYEKKAQQLNVPPDRVWWCGLCYLAFFNQGDGPTLDLKTDCHPHEVPPFPQQEKPRP